MSVRAELATPPHTSPQQGLADLLQALAPILGISIRLRFGQDARPGLFHEPALTAMVRTLLDGDLTENALLWVQATEAGREAYAAGDTYRFNVFAALPAHRQLHTLIERLPQLSRYLRSELRVPFGDTLGFQGLFHPHTDEPLRGGQPAVVFDARHALAERARFADAHRLRMRLLSPLRVLRDKTERGNATGDARYVHDAHQIRAVAARRAYDSLLGVAKLCEVWLPRPPDEPVVLAADVFQVDWEYRDHERNAKPMAGMLGWLDLQLRGHHPAWLDALLIAQRLGIGQRRSFGWGAFRLEALDGSGVVPPRRALMPLAQRAGNGENLRMALAESLPAGDAPADADDSAGLHALADALREGSYQPPPLQGHILMPADGRLRPLAVPPWRDRLAQRALARLITPALETIFNPESFGYRRGRSRFTLRDRLGQLYREGYRYYFEADIHGFFDHVQWHRLDTRLRALFGDDDAIGLILRWLAAPVEYQGHRIERTRGLPQGSPLSPVLANLLLEDLDADCAAHRFKLLRYADDFIILCKTERQAQAAWQRAESSIGELGLTLKPGKTAIGRLDDGQGLDFLGFRFIGDFALPVSRQPRTDTEVVIPESSWLAELVQRHPELHSEIQQRWGNRLQRPPSAATWTLPPAAHTTPDAREPDAPAAEPTAAAPVAATLAEGPAAAPNQGSLLCITETALLAQNQGRLRVITNGNGGRDFAWSDLEAVLLFSHARLTSGAIKAALDAGVALHFIDGPRGYRGRLVPEQTDCDDLDSAIAQRQCFADPQIALQLARRLVQARLHNQRETLRQRLRAKPAADDPVARIGQLSEQTETADQRDTLNGYEGIAARVYFEALAATLPEWVPFNGRNRRPPRDPFNALLSLGYTVLYSRTQGLAQAAGFHPRIGFYHQPHGRHAVLASDLMEPFRHLVERTACSVLNRRELQAEDFHSDPELGCRIDKPALRRYLARLAEAMTRRMTTLEEDRGDFHDLMLRQLRSLDRLRRAQADPTPWFFRTR